MPKLRADELKSDILSLLEGENAADGISSLVSAAASLSVVLAISKSDYMMLCESGYDKFNKSLNDLMASRRAEIQGSPVTAKKAKSKAVKFSTH